MLASRGSIKSQETPVKLVLHTHITFLVRGLWRSKVSRIEPLAGWAAVKSWTDSWR